MKAKKKKEEKLLAKPEASILKLVDCKDFGLESYLNEHPLDLNLPLSPKGEFTFHWGDWAQSCDFQRSQVQSNEEHAKRLSDLENVLSELKEQKVWVNNKVSTKVLSLFDLYRSYLDTRIRKIWFHEKSQHLMISLQGEMGPFIPLTSMRWFDKDLYACFIFRKILFETSPNRNFRVGLNSPVVVHFNNSMVDTQHVFMHQLSKGGVLFKVMGMEAFNRLLVSSDLLMEFDTVLFGELGKTNTAQDFKKVLANESCDLTMSNRRNIYKINMRQVAMKYGNLENYRTSNSKEFYFFIGWEDLSCENDGQELGPLMSYFMSGAEIIFHSELDKVS